MVGTRPAHEAGAIVVGVIFSRDRAMQLEAALNSLVRHCADVSLLDLHVLYKASSERLKRQYLVLQQRWPNQLRITFHEESHFRNDLLAILGLVDNRKHWTESFPPRVSARLTASGWFVPSARAPWENVLLLVDDNVFIRRFELTEAVRALEGRRKAIGFSLRLGRNVTYSYVHRRVLTQPQLAPIGERILSFNWTGVRDYFGYPLEVSSSIYSTSVLAGLLATLDYAEPNSLETSLSRAIDRFGLARKWPLLLCFDTSVTFCNPINKVQAVSPDNPSGESAEFSATALADLFDAGLQIDTDALAGFEPNSCHSEVPFKFIQARPSHC